MPRKKKSEAAKVRINKQIRSNKGQFIINEDEYKPSDDYSEDSLDDEFINKRINKLNNFTLVWSNTNDIHKKTRKPYTGNSKATKYRKYGPSGDFTKAAKLTQPITNFFQIKNIDDELENIENYNEMFEDNENDNGMENTETGDENDDGMRNIESGDESDDESDDKNDDETEDENDNEMDDNDNNDDDEINDSDDEINANDMEKNEDNSFDSKLINLEKILSGNLKKISAYDYLRYRAIHVFFKGWKFNNLNQKQASLYSAKIIYEKGSYKAYQIRKWARYWIEYNILPKSLQGCHQKIKSIIDDEDAIEQSLLFIRENKGKITPKKYQTFVKQILFPNLGLDEFKKSISIKTSCIWLKKLGLVPQLKKKGIYFDGHEREDVIEYRKEFLDKMLIYEKFMPIFEGENMERLDPLLLPNEKTHILVTHDECLFYANDDKPIIWAPLGELPLRKKGQGKSIMVSEFLTEIDGRLKLNEDEILLYPEIPVEARKFLKPGKNEEGWWTADHLLDQVINYAIPIFETKYPNSIGIFAFDNSTNHGAMAKDALNVNKMNVNPGGKQAIMRSTFFGLNHTFQSMVFPSDHPTFPNQPKGMKQILIERNLWYDSLIGHCQLCKLKIEDITRTDCCMHKILSLQEDFKLQTSQLQEEIEKRGHLCIFYPKFHCELNFIEMYWGAAKRYTRENCDYTWLGLQKIVPEALDSISSITIRKFARKSWRYMDIYRKGISGKLAEFAVKKYKSHRRVPDNIYNEIK